MDGGSQEEERWVRQISPDVGLEAIEVRKPDWRGSAKAENFRFGAKS